MFDAILKKRIVLKFSQDVTAKVISDISYFEEDSSSKMDIYLPCETTQKPLPCVFLVHGLTSKKQSPKDWGLYISWAEYFTASGFACVVMNHGLCNEKAIGDSERYLAKSVDYVRQNADVYSIDSYNIGLFYFSGGGILMSYALKENRDFIKAVAGYYTKLEITRKRSYSDDFMSSYSPVRMIHEMVPKYPFYLVKAKKDLGRIKKSIDAFYEKAKALSWDMHLSIHESGRHAFDIMTDNDRSREIINETMNFFKKHMLEDEY